MNTEQTSKNIFTYTHDYFILKLIRYIDFPYFSEKAGMRVR